MSTLHDDLARLTALPRILVACDYDGTLAELVDDPAHAWPHPEAVAALIALTACAGVEVGVVSGRARQQLAALSGLPASVHLIGSHGAEFDADAPLDDRQRATLTALTDEVIEAAASLRGATIEHKPTSVVLHTRTCDPILAAPVVLELERRFSGQRRVHIRWGKDVVEFTVVVSDKGTALRELRDRLAVDGVLFVGDDVTDEDVFAVLGPGDVGVKVGDGETRARHRVADPAAVVTVLQAVVAARS